MEGRGRVRRRVVEGRWEVMAGRKVDGHGRSVKGRWKGEWRAVGGLELTSEVMSPMPHAQ